MTDQAHPAAEAGYINFFELLGLEPEARTGDVRKQYRKLMKNLVMEIAATEITEEKRDRYLLTMAQYNAAFLILRNNELRDIYWKERSELIALELRWREAVSAGADNAESLRREYDRRLRDFLSRYVEETMLEAGRDKECVEASHWDAAHERHATRILRHYRHRLFHTILERLPYVQVTPPAIDWDERARTVQRLLKETA